MIKQLPDPSKLFDHIGPFFERAINEGWLWYLIGGAVIIVLLVMFQ